MSSIVLRFLGGFHVAIGDRVVTQFATDKTRALLAYLALEPTRPHTRNALAALFWPDVHDHHARVNLRNTLYRLRKTLDGIEPGCSDKILTVTRYDVQFNREDAFVDAHEFQARLDAILTHAHASLRDCPVCVAHLEEAVDFYQGEVLAGMNILDAPPFEEWLLLRRELLFHQALKALADLIEIDEQLGKTDLALGYAMRSLALDPFREKTHRQVMRLRARQGLPEQALAQYDALRRLLQEEMAVEPSEESADLARRIALGEFDNAAKTEDISIVRPAPTTSTVQRSPQADWSEAPQIDRFFGRSNELAQLEKWFIADQCRMVAILGIGGMGKTTLAAQSVRALAHEFDEIVWRSVLNAPQLEEILPSILQILSNQQLSELPDLLDEQFALLFVYLRQRRVLLVLDNLESLLAEEQAGAFRSGYAAYGQLMRQMATRDHRSHLLVTSRERPQGYIRMERDSSLVRSMRLGGLDAEAGQELLRQRGVTDRHGNDDGDQATLVSRYSGNPLALKLVADTVHELFAGDVASFLTEEPLVFDDVRAVLDQQFRRLSLLEQEILFWLAVQRESVIVSSLRTDLLQAPPVRVLLEALRSLQRRSLIDQQDGGFVLQNVVIEYLTDRLIQAAVHELESGEIDLLHRHALLKAESKAYVRLSQSRLILEPIGQNLLARNGRAALIDKLRSVLAKLRVEEVTASGYAAGNVLNLILHLDIDPADFDFSGLTIRQAYLQNQTLTGVNFAGADLSQSVFTDDFSSVFALAISPDGGLLVAGTDNGEIRLWQLPERRPHGALHAHKNRVLAVLFSADGRRLFSAGMDRHIRIWDVETGQVVMTLSGHQRGVRSLAIHPDGTLLASASQDQTVRVWSIDSGALLATLEAHTDWVNGVAFHPDGEILATGGHDRTICLWSVSEIVRRSQSGDGSLNLDTPLAKLHGHEDTIVVLAFSPDGSVLASSGGDATIRLWDVVSRHVLATLRGHSHWVRSLAFDQAGTMLASGSADGTVRLWDVAGQRGLNTLTSSDQVWSVALTPDDEMLVCGGLDGAIYLWNLRSQWSGQAYSMLKGYVAPIGSVAYSPSGDVLAAADEGKGWVRLWDLESAENQVRRSRLLLDHSAVVRSVAFSPDGSKLVSGGEDRVIRVWDVASGACLDRLHGHTQGLHCVAFDMNGSTMASGGDDATVHLWHVDAFGQGQLVNVLHGHTGSVHAVAFSPAGDVLASVSEDSSVRLWDPATGDCIQVLSDYAQDFWSIAFCPDGVTLAGGGRDRLIRLWDLRDLNHIRFHEALAGHTGAVLGLAFSPLGSILASASEDGTVRLWDVPNRTLQYTLQGRGQSVMSVAFHPAGKVLASGGFGGLIRLWDPATGAALGAVKPPGPYAGMNIAGITGITRAQKAALVSLGAIDEAPVQPT